MKLVQLISLASLLLFVQSGEVIFHECVILRNDGVLRLSGEKDFEVLTLTKVNINFISFHSTYCYHQLFTEIFILYLAILFFLHFCEGFA